MSSPSPTSARSPAAASLTSCILPIYPVRSPCRLTCWRTASNQHPAMPSSPSISACSCASLTSSILPTSLDSPPAIPRAGTQPHTKTQQSSSSTSARSASCTCLTSAVLSTSPPQSLCSLTCCRRQALQQARQASWRTASHKTPAVSSSPPPLPALPPVPPGLHLSSPHPHDMNPCSLTCPRRQALQQACQASGCRGLLALCGPSSGHAGMAATERQ